MKILVIADIHGRFDILQKIMDDAEGQEFDVIVAPGDFTDMFDIPPNFTQLDVADIVIQKLLIPNKPLLCVLGNHDPYEIIDVFNDYGANLHNRVRVEAGFSFVGWGGAPTPFNTLFEPSEEETKEALNNLRHDIKGKFVLVVHAPPKDTKLDIIKPNKHVGSAAIRKMIADEQPPLVISAHIHENSGTSKIGKSTVFYPGPAYKGSYGIASIEDGEVKCVVKKVNV